MKLHIEPTDKIQTVEGNHPANPYAAEAAELPRLEDREGWPFAGASHRRPKHDLSDEAQIGKTPTPPSPPAVAASDDEPEFVLRASDPLSGMMVRFWANCNVKVLPRAAAAAHELAQRMDAWRSKHGGTR